jgi:hypothetical protein
MTDSEKDLIATIEMQRRENLKFKELLLIYEKRIAKLGKVLILHGIKEPG